jgi:uncharacterized protein
MNYFKLYGAFFACFILNLNIGINAQEQNSLLWEISGKGLTKPSYLFGTIHALPKEKFFLSEIVKEKFMASDKIILEMKLDDPGMMSEVYGSMSMKDTTVDDLLTKEDLKLVTQFFSDSLGIALSTINKVKPLLLSSFILEKYTGPDAASYEKSFVQLTKSESKEMLGLETVKEQISYIDKIPLKEQCKLLVSSVTDYEKSKQEYMQLINAYLEQNIEKLYQMILAEEEFKNYAEFLIFERNRNWVPHIEKLIKDQKCFIAVGSGHLAGEYGLLTLLRNEGYVVKAVVK